MEDKDVVVVQFVPKKSLFGTKEKNEALIKNELTEYTQNNKNFEIYNKAKPPNIIGLTITGLDLDLMVSDGYGPKTKLRNRPDKLINYLNDKYVWKFYKKDMPNTQHNNDYYDTH